MTGSEGKSEVSEGDEAEAPGTTVFIEADRWIRLKALIFLLLCSAVFLAAAVFGKGEVPTAGCGFRNLAGISCPLCGLTRGIQSLVRGDVQSALRDCPLSVLVCAALSLLIAGSLYVLISGRSPVTRLGVRLKRGIWIACGSAVLANWIYRLANGYV